MSCNYCKNTTSNICPNCVPSFFITKDNEWDLDFISDYYFPIYFKEKIKELNKTLDKQLEGVENLNSELRQIRRNIPNFS